MKQKFSLGLIIFLLILFVDGFYTFVDTATELVSEPPNVVDVTSYDGIFVERIVDADTIKLTTGEKVRYIGIDTPETVHPTKGVECYGKIASEKNAELVAGKEVRLEKDVSETDRYGRLLRYVYVIEESTDSAEIFVNEYLVREGFAKASSYPPDIKYQDLFREAESEARQLKKGLWGEGC